MKTVSIDGTDIFVPDSVYYKIFILGYQQCIEDLNELTKKQVEEGSETE